MDKDEILNEIQSLKEARKLQIQRANQLQTEMSQVNTNIIRTEGVLKFLEDKLNTLPKDEK